MTSNEEKHITAKGLEKMIEAVTFIAAFTGAILFSTICNFTYDDYEAANERVDTFKVS